MQEYNLIEIIKRNKLDALHIIYEWLKIESYKRNKRLFCMDNFYPRGLLITGGIGRVYIERNVAIAPNVTLIPSDHKYNEDFDEYKGGKIIIKENVWIGANVIILKDVIIEKGAIVGAGSVVTRNIPENEIWAGNPAKKIGNRNKKYRM